MAEIALTPIFDRGQVVGYTNNERGLMEAEVLTGLETEELFSSANPSLRLLSKP